MKSVVMLSGVLAALFAACTLNDNMARLNHIQMIGSHNSYKKPLDLKIKALMVEQNADAVARIDYSHPPLSVQLNMGMRHFEIDIVK
ncbi:MAG: Ca2+-dependent phosphoinositide-specific phospholipase C, partial [Paraglaciecola sp.]